jgi:hypothetical protein
MKIYFLKNKNNYSKKKLYFKIYFLYFYIFIFLDCLNIVYFKINLIKISIISMQLFAKISYKASKAVYPLVKLIIIIAINLVS